MSNPIYIFTRGRLERITGLLYLSKLSGLEVNYSSLQEAMNADNFSSVLIAIRESEIISVNFTPYSCIDLDRLLAFKSFNDLKKFFNPKPELVLKKGDRLYLHDDGEEFTVVKLDGCYGLMFDNIVQFGYRNETLGGLANCIIHTFPEAKVI